MFNLPNIKGVVSTQVIWNATGDHTSVAFYIVAWNAE